LAGVVRDAGAYLFHNPETGYIIVFVIEALMILTSLFMLSRIDVSAFKRRASDIGLVERAALANEA
jgi:hypothetical protein